MLRWSLYSLWDGSGSLVSCGVFSSPWGVVVLCGVCVLYLGVLVVVVLGGQLWGSIGLPLRRSVYLGGSNCLSFGKYQIDMVYINVYVSAEVLDNFIIVVLYDAHVFYCPSLVFV